MEATEIKDALAQIKSSVEAKATEQSTEVKGMIEALEAKMKTETSASISELKSALEAIQAHADKLDVKLQSNGAMTTNDTVTYDAVVIKGLADNFEQIKSVSKGRNASIELKTVGDMTASANLTGSVVNTYQGGVAMTPSQMINFADLVPTVNSSTGSYVIYRESGAGEGSISSQGTPGAAKTQKDYDFTAVTFTATYISGYARYAKQMAQDLPFLQSFLPNALRRDYFKAENSIFYTALAAVATASTTTKTVDIEQIVADMGVLEASDFLVNGIVMNPKDWGNIAVTKPSNYSLPGIVVFQNGKLFVNGVPVYKASWVPANKYIIGDWSYAKKVLVDGLAVEFFEQDADNVTKNLITARVESRTVLGIDRPDAFILGTFAQTSF